MPKKNYVRQPRFGDLASWVDAELAAVERSIASIPATLASEDVSSTSYALVIGDQDKVKTTTNGSAVTLTVPTHASEPFELGSMVYFYQEGAGTATLVGASGVTVRSRPGLVSAGQDALFFVWKLEDNVWVASGDLTTGVASAVSMNVSAGALMITGVAPTVKTSIVTGAGLLTITGVAPTIKTSQVRSVSVGALTVVGYAPEVLSDREFSVSAGAMTITGVAPTASS